MCMNFNLKWTRVSWMCVCAARDSDGEHPSKPNTQYTQSFGLSFFFFLCITIGKKKRRDDPCSPATLQETCPPPRVTENKDINDRNTIFHSHLAVQEVKPRQRRASHPEPHAATHSVHSSCCLSRLHTDRTEHLGADGPQCLDGETAPWQLCNKGVSSSSTSVTCLIKVGRRSQDRARVYLWKYQTRVSDFLFSPKTKMWKRM